MEKSTKHLLILTQHELVLLKNILKNCDLINLDSYTKDCFKTIEEQVKSPIHLEDQIASWKRDFPLPTYQ